MLTFSHRGNSVAAPFFALPLMAILVSCQTLHKERESVSLPAVVQPMFQVCTPSENEARLNIEKDGVRIFASTVVWALRGPNESNLQINSPLGETIFELRRGTGGWQTIPPNQILIKEESSGVVNVGGYDIPVKSEELGCMLSGLWPAAWLKWLEVTPNKAGRLRMEGSDGFRGVSVELPNLSAISDLRASGLKSCAYFNWGGFLGFFQNHATLCRETISGGLTVRLTGINHYQVDWTINDG